MIIVAGGIAGAAIVIFFVLGVGSSAIHVLYQGSGSGSNGSGSVQIQPLQIMVQNVNVSKLDSRNANVKVIFVLHNPNRVSAILENVHYTVSVDHHKMTSGDTGQILENFLDTQASSLTIVSGSDVTLKPTDVAIRNNITSGAWDKMENGTASYVVDGWYAFRTTASLETNYQEKDFSLTFH